MIEAPSFVSHHPHQTICKSESHKPRADGKESADYSDNIVVVVVVVAVLGLKHLLMMTTIRMILDEEDKGPLHLSRCNTFLM